MMDKKILILTGDLYEDLELWYPKLRLQEAGASVTVAGKQAKQVYNSKHGYPCQAAVSFKDISAAYFDGLIIPGGYMPDKLRREAAVLQLVREFNEQGKLIAAICHAGWIPISARIYQGVRVTGVSAIKDDLVNAGAIYEDASVVVDRNHITSRTPADLPDFCKAIIEWLS